MTLKELQAQRRDKRTKMIGPRGLLFVMWDKWTERPQEVLFFPAFTGNVRWILWNGTFVTQDGRYI